MLLERLLRRLAVIQFLSNAVVRWMEFQADRYSHRLVYDMCEPLIALSKANKAEVDRDWLVSMYHDNHPSILERVRRAKALKASDASRKTDYTTTALRRQGGSRSGGVRLTAAEADATRGAA